jgi:hypothetical protein
LTKHDDFAVFSGVRETWWAVGGASNTTRNSEKFKNGVYIEIHLYLLDCILRFPATKTYIGKFSYFIEKNNWQGWECRTPKYS